MAGWVEEEALPERDSGVTRVPIFLKTISP